MAKLARKKGTTSQIFHAFILDSSVTTGAGKTGLAFNTASLVCRYITSSGTLSASITLEDITTLGTYAAPTSNAHMRFKEVSNADPSKGLYEIQVHNDWMNLSGGNLLVMMAGAANMAPLMLEVDLQADVNLTHIAADAQSALDLKDFADAGYDPATNKVQGVVLVDTLTTYTGNTVQTGDSYAIVNHATYGNSALRTRGDAAWITATGFSTHAAADVWAVATRAITDKAGFSLAADQSAVTVGTVTSASLNLAQPLSALTGYPTTVGGSLYFIRQLEKNKLVYNKSTDVMTLYDDDGTTAKGTAHTMTDDASTATRGAA